MQLPNPPEADKFPAIEIALQPERLGRYLAAAKSKELAFTFYTWNLMLCECFVFPLHFAEVSTRNALNLALLHRAGANWYADKTFIGILDERFRFELKDAVYREGKQHGDKMTAHHVVSALTFGFWEHLVTKRFERYLWSRGLRATFQGAPKEKTFEDLHALIESVRRWRNRIAHHRAIFDKGPMRKYQDTLELISWACPTTTAYVAASSKLPAALGLRPR